MKFKELKNKSKAELHKILVESREQLRNLRFKVASKQLKNIREIRDLRRRIARILFLLDKATPAAKEADVKNDK